MPEFAWHILQAIGWVIASAIVGWVVFIFNGLRSLTLAGGITAMVVGCGAFAFLLIVGFIWGAAYW